MLLPCLYSEIWGNKNWAQFHFWWTCSMSCEWEHGLYVMFLEQGQGSMSRKGSSGILDMDDHGTKHTCPMRLLTQGDPPTDHQHKASVYYHNTVLFYRASCALHILTLGSTRKDWKMNCVTASTLISVKSLLILCNEFRNILQRYRRQ